MTLKQIFCTILGFLGGVITSMFGGWSAAMTTLVIFMALDYITGIVVAGVFRQSEKTKDGGLESIIGWKGIIRKGCTLAMVMISHRLDILFECNYIMNTVVIAFISNELISLIENFGLMGVPIPEPIRKAISVLKEEADGTDKKDDDK